MMDKTETLVLPSAWLDGPIPTVLVGVGGTGSEMLDGLVRIHNALLALGHPAGLSVTAFDPDEVSLTNVVRQRYLPADVGQNKAMLTIHRYNCFYGLDWRAYPEPYSTKHLDNYRRTETLLVTCVDSARFRQQIAGTDDQDPQNRWNRSATVYWLDTGNDATGGQYVLGELLAKPSDRQAIPHVGNLYPELLDDERVAALDADHQPTCSAAEALAAQDLFTNRTIANAACNLLWQWFRQGVLRHHGGYIDTRSQTVLPLRIDPKVWLMMGYQCPSESEEAA